MEKWTFREADTTAGHLQEPQVCSSVTAVCRYPAVNQSEPHLRPAALFVFIRLRTILTLNIDHSLNILKADKYMYS
jgi:hypothetical protein